MYNDIGNKIKILAKVIFVLESLPSVIAGLLMLGADEDAAGIGLIIMLVGPIVAWISSWFLYGFGELIDKACEIARNTAGLRKGSAAQAGADSAKTDRLERLRVQGLISEAEYCQLASGNRPPVQQPPVQQPPVQQPPFNGQQGV